MQGIVNAEAKGEHWCLTVVPGEVDRGHLLDRPSPVGPAETAREMLGDAGLALAFAAGSVAISATPWGAWGGAVAVLLTLVLPARRVFEALLVSAPGGHRVRDLRRVLGLLALVMAGTQHTVLLASVPLAWAVLLGAEGVLRRATAPRWRLRWRGAEVSTHAIDLESGDLITLPAGVPCPAQCRVERNSALVVSFDHGAPQRVEPGAFVSLGAQSDSELHLRVLAVPHARRQAWEEQPQASLRLDRVLQVTEATSLVLGCVLLVARGEIDSGLTQMLLAASLLWLVPLGLLQQAGALQVRRTVERFWEAGVHLGTAAALDRWSRVRSVVVLPSALLTGGWDAVSLHPEPAQAAWPALRAALVRGASRNAAIQVVPGQGLSARVGGDTWIAGTPDFVGTEGFPEEPGVVTPGTQRLVVRQNDSVVSTGTGKLALRSGARSDVASLRGSGLVFRLLTPTAGETSLHHRVGVTPLAVDTQGRPPGSWRLGLGPPEHTLSIAAEWPDGLPPGPSLCRERGTQGTLAAGSLLGVAPALKEARFLRRRLTALTLTAPIVLAGTLAAGLLPAMTVPLLLATALAFAGVLGGVTSQWLILPDRSLPLR
jgi:hypothetical protein